MHPAPTRLFLPGFATRVSSYREGIPAGWEPLQPPAPGQTRGSFAALTDWLAQELERRPKPALIAGYSMGAALAIVAAARDPDAVAGLILIAPSGLPVVRPVRRGIAGIAIPLLTGGGGHALISANEMLSAPISGTRLGRTIVRLDLRTEMLRVREAGLPAMVVGCDTDRFTTRNYCLAVARLVGGSYRELRLDGGHAWVFGHWDELADTLSSLDPDVTAVSG